MDKIIQWLESLWGLVKNLADNVGVMAESIVRGGEIIGSKLVNVPSEVAEVLDFMPEYVTTPATAFLVLGVALAIVRWAT